MSNSMIAIAKDLRPLLVERPELAALVGQNIFPLYAPEDTTGDFIIYQRTDGGCEVNLMCVSSEWCEVTFNAVSDSYERSVEIAEAIRSTLQGGTVVKNDVILDRISEDYVGVNNAIKYVQILVFSIGKPKKDGQ